jgi:hypothetical protein
MIRVSGALTRLRYSCRTSRATELRAPMTYTPPIEEQKFVLRHAAGIEELGGANAFPEASLDMVDAIVEGAGAFAAGEWAPLNRTGDTIGAKWSPKA